MKTICDRDDRKNPLHPGVIEKSSDPDFDSCSKTPAHRNGSLFSGRALRNPPRCGATYVFRRRYPAVSGHAERVRHEKSEPLPED
jgi:hypothetical protein